MDYNQLKLDIAALPLDIRLTNDAQVIADALSIGRTKIIPTQIGNGRVLEALGLEAGNAFLDVINTAVDFRYVKVLLSQGWLSIDSNMVRTAVDSLVPSVLTSTQAEALKNLAVVQDIVSARDVSMVLDGSV